MSFLDGVSRVSAKVRDSFAVVSAKVKSINEERDLKMRGRQARKDLQLKLDAQSARDDLARNKLRRENRALIDKARAERFDESFAGRLTKGIANLRSSDPKPVKGKVAGVKRGSLVNFQGFSSSVDSSVLRIKR